MRQQWHQHSFRRFDVLPDGPVFDIKLSSYNGFGTQTVVFRSHIKLDKCTTQSALLLIGQLSGLAWEFSETLADHRDRLEEHDAFDKLLAL